MSSIEYITKLNRRAQLKARLDSFDYAGKPALRSREAGELKDLTKALNDEYFNTHRPLWEAKQ